jgi:hypothetical protein
VSHTEFIESKETGELFFLETSSRVGGANLADMVYFASGINLWKEWAKVEISEISKTAYVLPKINNQHAGIVVSLSRFENPDTSSFNDPEIIWRMQKPWHIGLIVVSDTIERVKDLLDKYTERIAHDFHASAKAPDKLT